MSDQRGKWDCTSDESRGLKGRFSAFRLVGKHTGQTAILVASGRTLDAELDKLRPVFRAPILAVCKAYPGLEVTGVPVNYAFMIDALQPVIKNHRETALVCARKGSAEFKKNWNGPKFEFDDVVGGDAWSAVYRERNQLIPYIPGGGNVSCAMLGIAVRLMGFRRIIFVGHDFYTEHPYTFDKNNVGNIGYDIFRRWTIDFVKMHPHVEFISCVPMKLWNHPLIRPMKLEEAVAVFAA